MRTEVKIGIAVGLFLAVVVTGYIIYANSNNKNPQAGKTPDVAIKTDNSGGGLKFSDTPSVPPLDRTATVTPAHPTPTTVASIDRLAHFTPTSGPALGFPPVATAPSVLDGPRVTFGGSTDTTGVSSTGLTPAAGAASTYIVKEGDSMWKIAQEKYGDGSKHKLISDANPTVKDLRPGQKLIIPPAPSAIAHATDTPTTGPTGGQVSGGAPANSGETYIVQAGDTGLWAIAKKKYGDGSKYDLIKKANPGVRTDVLRPGQKLIIPALKDSPSRTGTTQPVAGSRSPASSSSPRKATTPAIPSNRPVFD